jgi:hypothetical protein
MLRWLSGTVPEWVTLVVFLVGLPALVLAAQALIHRRAPRWERGEHNDATAIMASIAAVVYSVAIGLCVITLWEQHDEAYQAIDAEATNLAAVAEGGVVFDSPVRDDLRAAVIAYNRKVIDEWPRLTGGDVPVVGDDDLGALRAYLGGLTPETEAQRAFLLDAVQRLGRATELRAAVIRQATEPQLPNVLWVSVLGGSVVVLMLSLTCGVRDRTLRRILLAGVAATIGINLFLVIELSYPFYGSISVGPGSYAAVVAGLEQAR